MDVGLKNADKALSAIISEPLDALLSALRRQTAPLGRTFLRAIDLQAPRSFPSMLNRGDVIELQGSSGSGKTHLIYHLLITCVLPETSVLKGWEKVGIIYDLENDFSLPRFRQLLKSRIMHLHSLSDNGPINADSLVEQCLTRLCLFRPKSTVQLAASLLHLPTYHRRWHPNSEIGILTIDSLSTFHWSDKFTADQSEHSTTDETFRSPTLTNPLVHVLTSLKRLLNSHSPGIVLTNWGLYPQHSSDEIPRSISNFELPAPNFFRQHLSPFPYATHSSTGGTNSNSLPLTHHVTLSYIANHCSKPMSNLGESQFPISKDHDAQKPLETVGTDIIARIRTPGSVTVGKFSFRITGDEILVG